MPSDARSTQYPIIVSAKTKPSIFVFWYDGAEVVASALRNETQRIASLYPPSVYPEPEHVPLDLDAAIRIYAETRNSLFKRLGSQPEFPQLIEAYQSMPPNPASNLDTAGSNDTHPSASRSYAAQPNMRKLIPYHDLALAAPCSAIELPNPYALMPGTQYQGTGPLAAHNVGVFPRPTGMQASTDNSNATADAQGRTGLALALAPSEMFANYGFIRTNHSNNNIIRPDHQFFAIYGTIGRDNDNDDGDGDDGNDDDNDNNIRPAPNQTSPNYGTIATDNNNLRDSFSNGQASAIDTLPDPFVTQPIGSEQTSVPNNNSIAQPLINAPTRAASAPTSYQRRRDSLSNEQASGLNAMPNTLVQQSIGSEDTAILNNNPTADHPHREDSTDALPFVDVDLEVEEDKGPPSSKRKRKDSSPDPWSANRNNNKDARGSPGNARPA